MPYTVKTEGMEELDRMLRALGEKAEGIASGALYEGAGIMADEINKGAKTIKTAPFKYAAGGQMRLPSPEEKAAVLSGDGAGIARFKNTGRSITTSIGFGRSGYANVNGKRKPIPLIVNSINSGTSFMKKQPFVRKAVRNARKQASEAITQTIIEGIETITENKREGST